MANNQNTMRDMKRSILKAVRDSQKTKQDAMDEYVAARVNIKSLEGRLEEAREKATLLRRKAKDAGNTSAELKTADDLIDARWTGTEDGSAEDGSPENADPGTVNPEREHPAMEENMQGGMPGEPNRWEGGSPYRSADLHGSPYRQSRPPGAGELPKPPGQIQSL